MDVGGEVRRQQEAVAIAQQELQRVAWIFMLDGFVNAGPDQRVARAAYDLAASELARGQVTDAYYQALAYAGSRRQTSGIVVASASALVAAVVGVALATRKGR